jgi:hypothetical protein
MDKKLTGALAALAAALAVPALADEERSVDENPPAGDEQATAESDAPAFAGGLRVVRDKKTGELRAPNANELAEMEAMEKAARQAKGARSAAPAEPVVVTHPNGMRSAELGPEYLISLEGTRKEDGTVEKSHDAGDKDTNKSVASDALPKE